MKLSFVSLTALVASGSAIKVTCGADVGTPRVYENADVVNAFSTAKALVQAGRQVGGYPKEFVKTKEIPMKVPGPYKEFPLVKGQGYNGGRPGPDRIVMNADFKAAQFVYHPYEESAAFEVCDVEN